MVYSLLSSNDDENLNQKENGKGFLYKLIKDCLKNVYLYVQNFVRVSRLTHDEGNIELNVYKIPISDLKFP